MAKIRMNDPLQLRAKLAEVASMEADSQYEAAFRKQAGEWHSYRKWVDGRSGSTGAPLIADGLVRVRASIDGTSTGALVHAKTATNAGITTRTEQWLLFDTASGSAITSTFAGEDGNTYSLSTTREVYGNRLPWPTTDPASGPVTSFLYPVSWGNQVSSAAFFAGIHASFQGKPVRYAITRMTIDTALPAPPGELPNPRRWEEVCSRASTSPSVARQWTYAEAEVDGSGGATRKTRIHVAWRTDDAGYKAPPAVSVMSWSLVGSDRAMDLADWLQKVASSNRLNLGDGAAAVSYAVGDTLLYDRTAFAGLPAMP